MKWPALFFIILAGCRDFNTFVTIREFDYLRESQANYALKSDFAILYTRMEGEELAGKEFAKQAEVIALVDPVRTNTEMNKQEISNANVAVSVLKSIFGVVGALFTIALAVISTLLAAGYLRSKREGTTATLTVKN